MHVHTLFSHCSISQPIDIIRRAAAIGLDGVGIMDHNETRGADDAVACAAHLKSAGEIPGHFLVIPGTEVGSRDGHICALFVREKLPTGLNTEETVRLIHEAGGLALAPHPFHSTGINEAVFSAPFDAVEVECGSVFGRKLVRLNQELAHDSRLDEAAKLGASDAHYIRAVGSCYTVIDAREPTLEGVRQAIEDRRCEARSSLPCDRLRKLLGGVPKLK
jgi:predicted metal-dependent phosphoesterase TrpH